LIDDNIGEYYTKWLVGKIRQNFDTSGNGTAMTFQMKLHVIVKILFVLIFLYWYIYFNGKFINSEIDRYELHRKSIKNLDNNFSSYFYVYFGEKIFGQSFSHPSIDLLRTHFGIDLFDNSCCHQSLTDNEVLKSQPVFLTALSDNHFGEGMIMLRKLFSVYNCWTIWIIYDLGLQ